jgi:class 3 adenylate cyclase/tetratricopeptide (TPR) repeat protein
VTCPVCGTVAVPGARFCHNCGAALPAAAGLPATERRVVTVLFGDLSDFTAWAEDLDPERVGAVTDRVLAALAGAVKTFGGHVDKLTGDGIMAVFGAPVAHEDDAERAVRAALSMQRAVRRVLDDERGGGAPLGLRVGLNTGEVVAGIQAAIEYTVIGDTVNTAARLADAAAIGAVYAGVTTSTASRHVASWRRLRPLRLKGKREPVEAYELLGLHDAPGTRSGLGDEAPFVGREAELGRIAGRLAEVIDRTEPRVVVMTAEAGVGKSRFAAEVERFAAGYDVGPGRYAARTGARVLSVHCAAFGERRRLAPLADLARTAIGLPPETASAAGRPVVEERLRRLGQRLARVGHAGRDRQPPPAQSPFAVDQLLPLLGFGELPVMDGLAGRDEWSPAPDSPAETLPGAVADLLNALAREAPLLVVVDDLHDATAETIEALGATLSRLAGPVLVLLLGRPELVRTAGVLTRVADAEVLALPPLRGADAARLLTSYLGGGRLPQADEDRLLATAQGNPFYLAELVTLLIERGALTTVAGGGTWSRAARGEAGASGGWRLAPGSLSSRLLSRDLAAVLAARIDALPGDARTVLRDAAMIGDSVPATALEALHERRTGHDGRPAAVLAVELDRAVDELLHRRMLRRVRGGYAFATPLMREAAYAGIGRADLAERHAYLARWAAELVGTPPVTGTVIPATRSVVAGSGPISAALSRNGRDGARNGDGAAGPNGGGVLGTGTGAFGGGVGMSPETLDAFVAEHAERAVALADSVRLRADAGARGVAPLGVAALGRAARRAMANGEPELAVEYAERAAPLAGEALPVADRLVHAEALLQNGRPVEALGYAEKICANAGDAAATRAGALLIAGRAHRVLGDPARAVLAWQEALQVATEAGLLKQRAQALRRLGMADFLAGRLNEASNGFASAYQAALEAGDRRSQAFSLQNLAWVTTTRGDFAGTDAALGRAARLFAELGDSVGRAWIRGTTSFARLLAGRLAEARRLALAFLPFGERVGEAWAVGTLRAVEAFAAAELGDLAEADGEARRAYRDFVAAADDWGRGFALVVRGVVARGLGEPDHAADLLTDALGYGRRTAHPLLLGMAGTLRGFVELDRGDPAAAEADARAVLAMAGPQHALDSAQVGPRVLLASARLAGGDSADAVRLLAPVAAAPSGPSLLFPRRQAVSTYAAALLAACRVEEAVEWAEQAQHVPAEDVRSRVITARVLAEVYAAAGQPDQARSAAIEAQQLAYGTEQASERRAVRAVMDALSVAPPPASLPAASA